MIKQRMIYQIGDVVLHGHHKVPQTQNFQARGQSVELQDTYRVLTATAPHKTGIRLETVEIVLFSNGVFSASGTVELLKRQIGVFQDVISYVYISPEHAPEGFGCSCALCGCCPCQLLWLHNTGVLKSINVQSINMDVYSATITFELHSYWKPLNRLLWSTGTIGISRPSVKRVFADESNFNDLIMSYPTCDTFKNNCLQFYKRHYIDIDFLYNPFWQVQMNCNLPSNHPQIGYAKDWTKQKSDAIIHIHPWLWSAPPMSIYSFKNIVNKDERIQIRITRQETNQEIISQTSINLDRVNSIAVSAGVTLKASDILRVGDVESFAHVIRDKDIILYVADAVNRTDGDYPGYLTPGTNTVYVNPKGINYAYSHTFRSV